MMEQQDHPKKLSRKQLALLVILVIGFGLYNRDYLKFFFFYRYVCMDEAIDIGNGNKLAVCDRESYGYYDDMRAIVYDTSGQLIMPEVQRTVTWQNAAERLGLRRRSPDRDPNTRKFHWVTYDAYGKVTHIFGHFYYVLQ